MDYEINQLALHKKLPPIQVIAAFTPIGSKPSEEPMSYIAYSRNNKMRKRFLELVE